MYVGTGSPIPLDSVDAFWRKLDLTPSISVEYGDLNVDHRMQRFRLPSFVYLPSSSTLAIYRPAHLRPLCAFHLSSFTVALRLALTLFSRFMSGYHSVCRDDVYEIL
ncbi:unnamed protein product [Lactuca virosa]|uniref:Uncharacterized protein n=1 Tax=Lactuca virosa TaxID=75947 RepID=A0AAU9NSG7_9ASTR|nr:unnamed protein product [Lactuca virosa]